MRARLNAYRLEMKHLFFWENYNKDDDDDDGRQRPF